MIGTHGLSRWLNILLFAGDDDDGQMGPLFKLASCRGKLMELLQLEMLEENPDPDQREIVERAFPIGMLSLAHVVLGVSPEQAIEELGLSDEIRRALQDHERKFGELLYLTKAIEESDLAAVQTTLSNLGLTRMQLQRAQSESFAWVNSL
jgi:EAL and modified HD-GYP domain-containing signal transduction protein